MKNLGVIEIPSIRPKSILEDTPLRNGLRHARLKQETEIGPSLAVQFADIAGFIADNPVLAAAFASKQDALGYTPLNRSLNLADLEDVGEALENLGLDLGGANDLWLPKQGGTMAGTIQLSPDRPLRFQPSSMPSAQTGQMEYDGKQYYLTPSQTRRTLQHISDTLVASEDVADTIDETDIFVTTIDANALAAGQIVRALLLGRYSTANGTDTVTIRFKVNGATVLSITTTAAAVTDTPFACDIVSTIRTIGATGTFWSYVQAALNNVNKHATVTSDESIDTTAEVELSVTVQWSAADPGNTISLDQSLLEMS